MFEFSAVVELGIKNIANPAKIRSKLQARIDILMVFM